MPRRGVPPETARKMGLPVNTNMPRVVYELMDLYPQANALRPSVIYVPLGPAPAKHNKKPDSNAAPEAVKSSFICAVGGFSLLQH